MSELTIEQVAEAARAKRAQDEAKRGIVAAQTAARFPEAVAFARLCESYFGPVSLKFASNGSDSIGKEAPAGMDWFATTPYRRGA